MTPPLYRAAVFDLDGTLTRPDLIDFEAIKHAIGCPLEETIIEHLPTLDDEARREAGKIIDRFEWEGVARAQPNPEAHQVLAGLSEIAVPCCILTRNSRRVAFATLQHMGFLPYVTDVIAREDAKPKPHPDGVLTFVRRWSLPPQQTLMIGDFHFDVRTGAAARVATALLTNGSSGNDHIRFPAGHPTHTIHALHELLRLFH